MATRTVQTTPSTSLSSSPGSLVVSSTSKTATTEGSASVGASGRPHPLRKRDANREQPPTRTCFHPHPPQQQQQQQQQQKQKAKSTKRMRQTSLTSCVRVRPRTIAFPTSVSASASLPSGSNNHNNRMKKEPRKEGEGDKSKELLGIIVITDDEDEDIAPLSSPPRKRQHVAEGQPKREDEEQTKPMEAQAQVSASNTSSPGEPKPKSSAGRAVGWEETEPGELLGLLRRDVKELAEQRNSYRHMLTQERDRTESANKEKKQLEVRVKEMELTLSNAKQERRHLAKAKRKIEELEKQVEELEAKANEKQATIALPDMTELDDLVSCEICTMKMWHPATIRECGHTFCESCLHDWFNQTYTQHVEQHPEFLQGPQIPLEYLAHQHLPAYAQEIQRMMAAWRAGVVQPVYTCPTCRRQVRSRPMEIFFVKDVVRKVVKVFPRLEGQERERSPEPKPNRLNRAVGTIWDGFFPE